jgi:hypothetical protein
MGCLTREQVTSKKREPVRHEIDAERWFMLHSLPAEKFIALADEAIVNDAMDKGKFLVGMVRECAFDESGAKLFETSNEVGDALEPMEIIDAGQHAVEVSKLTVPDSKKNSPPGNSLPIA